MNNIKFIFCLIFVYLVSCESPHSQPQPQPLSSELTITTVAHRFIRSQAILLNAKYDMITTSFGTSLYDGVKELSWYFRIPKKLTKDEGRLIVLDCVSQIVKNANNDKELKLFFNKEGFTQKNVDIVLISDLGKQEVYYPEITTISFHSNELGFYTNDPQKQYSYYTSEYESYDDAVAILKAQGREDILLEPELTPVNHEVQ